MSYAPSDEEFNATIAKHNRENLGHSQRRTDRRQRLK
jgi:hypothetical protein